MRRRQFITGLGSAAAWPVVARAQQRERMRRIGVMVTETADDPAIQARLAAFRQELERFGWSVGGNVRIDVREPQGSAEWAQVFAKELIALQPDVILSIGPQTTAMFQRESRAIPIVFVQVADPIAFGFVASLARPGGNITGFLQYQASITGKWLQMLKEIAPGLARVACVGAKRAPYDYFLRAAESLAPSLGIELVPTSVESAADIDRAIESFARVPDGGLLLTPGGTSILDRDLIIALAARYRLPAVYTARIYVTAGGLMSYGIDLVNIYRQAASYVDRILRGDEPADLPVQAPVRYETFLNLKTAKALGLTIPETLLATADEVIQ
jgi:putative tryptophan/tyrosine transport system substrate-binding protein